jgi:2-polyprenyl-6-methoxyphenol hydroxylase-like FAD-dependent oxidoreductase
VPRADVHLNALCAVSQYSHHKLSSLVKVLCGLGAAMSDREHTEVLIVGGGPVGLSLAMDLTQRGVSVIVAETRSAGEPPSVRCNHVSARTMEVFRRLGLVRAVRNAGLPADYPNDVAFRTTATGVEIGRIPIPCRAERYSKKDGPDGWWPTPEPPHRINQIYLEPVMFAHAAAMPGLRILNRTSVVDFEQHEDGVLAIARRLDTGQSNEIFASYVVGCDGAHSDARHRLGVALRGDSQLVEVQSTYFSAPQLLNLMPEPAAWAIDCINPRSCGLMFAIDGRERWLIHHFLRRGERAADVDRDRCVREILGVAASFAFDVLSQEDWTARRMLADRFRVGRVFLCGDAAHIWVPFAGYGMNAAIADAMNLSWMLAGVIKGWAEPALLEAYEIERRPITDQVSHYAMATSLARSAQQSVIPEKIEQLGPDGDAVRARLGQQAYDINVGQFCCGGLNFGYFYVDSPVIAYDGEAAPDYTIYDFSQSTVPGCRAPHLWLDGGQSLYDVLGPGFTLIRRDPSIDVRRLTTAATDRGVPFSIVDIDADEAETLYRKNLTLVRPDQHVAWRGDQLPDDPPALIDRIRGAVLAANS